MAMVAYNIGGPQCLIDARADLALFHSILYIVALDYDSSHGLENSCGCLFHSVEAFGAINRRLRDGTYTDITIAAVALIAAKEVRLLRVG